MHEVRSTKQALGHQEACEDVVAVLARAPALAAADGSHVRADQVVQSIQARVQRLARLFERADWQGHVLMLVRREFDRASAERLVAAARRFSGEPPRRETTGHAVRRKFA